MKSEYYTHKLGVIHTNIQKAIRKQFSRIVIVSRRADARFAKWSPDSVKLGIEIPVWYNGYLALSFDRKNDTVNFTSRGSVPLAELETPQLIQLLRQLEVMEKNIMEGKSSAEVYQLMSA